MVCNLDYIPSHLHTNDKPIIDEFFIGERLFYRCKPESLQKPYDNISLYDISHNRNFNNEETFKEEDVFYNIIEDDLRIKYEDLNFVSFFIKKLSPENITYNKKLFFDDISMQIVLKHSPAPCMYPHSVFEISIDGIIINKENYKNELGKKNKKYSSIRNIIRQELTSLMQTGFLDDSIDIEEINDL